MKTKLYDFFEISFNADLTNIVNPFDKKFTCTVTTASGREFSVNPFYNGENEFLVRVYADEIGIWTITAKDEKQVYLDKYSFECTQSSLGGKIRISSKNSEKTVYSNGKAYNMLGFECDWIFLLDQDNNEFPKAKKLIDSVADNGFNMMMANVIAMDVTWQIGLQGKNTQFDFSNPKNLPFVKNGDDIDFSHLNIDFFKHMDKVMDYLKDREIVIHLMIYVWNKFVQWPEICSEDDNRYFEYIIDRYQAYPNLIWDISKEALSYGLVTNQHLRDKCEYVRKNDAYHTLITMHDAGFCNNNPDSIDIVSVQNWANNLGSSMFALKNNNKGRLICNVEHGGYEQGIFDGFHGAYSDPKVCLERNYISLFMGIYGVYYWQNASWNIVVWDINQFAPEVRPKYEYYKHLREFMDKYHYENMYPMNPEDPTRFTLFDGKTVYMYKPLGARYITNLVRFQPDLTKEVTWFNPVTNEYKNVPITLNEQTYGIDCPWKEELAILIFEQLPLDQQTEAKPVLSFELDQ